MTRIRFCDADIREMSFLFSHLSGHNKHSVPIFATGVPKLRVSGFSVRHFPHQKKPIITHCREKGSLRESEEIISVAIA